MDNKILVAYATKHGATAEIAGRIGDNLADTGLFVDVLPVDEIDDLAAYDYIVLGSAVYAGQWLKEAVHFLKENEPLLATRPVWLFSSGPTGEGDPLVILKGWQFPEALQPLADRIRVQDITLFGGVLDSEDLNFGEKLIVKAVKAPLGDFRDWDKIDAWSSYIAYSLKEELPI
jgi:menaquinone-dependent protoporphyrinogen oxidase